MSRPLFFMRTGVVGSSPPDFYEGIEQKFGLKRYNIQKFKDYFLATGAPSDSAAYNYGKHELMINLAKALTEGQNVYYANYQNSIRSRLRMRGDVSQMSGAHIVHLVVQTPDSVTRSRIANRFRDPGSEIPTNRQPLYVARLDRLIRMQATLQLPDPEVEPHLLLDGSRDASELHELVDNYVAELIGSEPQQDFSISA